MGAIRTTCAYCGVGCGIRAEVDGTRSVAIAGDPDHPANRGRLCSKGTHLGETVGLDGRLLHPMVGEARVSWNEALGQVASRMRACIERHGPDSVAFYVSGQLLTEDYYVTNKLMKGFVGSANIDTNSRLCMASAVAAHNRAWGEDVVPCSYDDIAAADLILLVGSNTAWCHPVVWQAMEAARERRGTKLVVIDPRRTETAERADLHIPLAPDGDTALFTALLAEMARRGALDDAFLRDACSVPPGFWDDLNHDPAIDRALFARLADLFAASPRAITMFSQGANQSVGGTDKGNAIINLHLATGRINRPGAGPFSITGQPNAMGGREVGGLASTLACHLGFSAEERASVARFWGTDRLCREPGLKAVDLFRAVHSGKVRFVWIMATNPAVSMPDAGFVREALARCPHVVVSDVIAQTDTARLAHVRLPALAWGEKDGTVTNSERRVSRQRRLFPAPGEARADWRIVADVAARMGWGESFAWSSPAEVFREYAAMTRLAREHGKHLDLAEWAGCSDCEYERMQPFQWGGPHPLARRFPTADGKARIVAVSPPAARSPDPDFPLRLNTGRYRDQWHTMTRTGLSPRLAHHRREPVVEVHPADARRRRLLDGGLARVETPFGAQLFRVATSEGQRPGEIFVPMHWTDMLAGGGRTGKLAQPATDPHSGQPGFKNTPARLARVEPDWRAFLVSRRTVTPQAPYWVRSRVARGWLTELAGFGAVDCDALLPAGPRIEVADRERGMRRIAVPDEGGGLAAALFVTRSGTLPAREWIAEQLGMPGSGAEWLAGRSAAPAPDKGPLVCLCHDVGERQVAAAIAAGACDTAAVGAATKAGTNCGSCRPVIARMLESRPTMEPAE
ncbi:nitrate reductase [Pelagerythrobacter marinus]|uniref:nitrate reductase n=1 Tax=Pelagerythrobacter marinus TaxID=538382 RepID=UPI002036CFED|nr:nitrate reductase [Pelagerythrobacter marinus]USA40106.1 nitrate reductase [Pelagerythrobacter marinus]WPZ05772.1 nitrate reductase [Pelagerythrobacter marinus]